VPSSRTAELVARTSLAYGLLALGMVLLALLAWRANAQHTAAQGALSRGDAVLAAAAHLESGSQAHALALACLQPATTAPGVPLGPIQDGAKQANQGEAAWLTAANALAELVTAEPINAELVNAFNNARRDASRWDEAAAPVARQACASDSKATLADTQGKLRALAPQRLRLEASLKHLRDLAVEDQAAAASALQVAVRGQRTWQAALVFGSLLTALVSWLIARGTLLERADLRRKLFDEAQERDKAKDELVISQRRMRVLLDHVKDAVVAFDAQDRIQWVNPAGETLFGTSRQQLMGRPITLLMPELEAELRAAAKPERAAVTDEHGLPWISQHLTLQGLRAARPATAGAAPGPTQKVTLDVSLVQTRVDGQSVGVCVARDLSDLRRMQRDHASVTSALQHTAVPTLRELVAGLAHQAAQVRSLADAPVPSVASAEAAVAAPALALAAGDDGSETGSGLGHVGDAASLDASALALSQTNAALGEALAAQHQASAASAEALSTELKRAQGLEQLLADLLVPRKR
jgi:two-component system, NtrC family, sensor histidine kinase KinB